ncbi:MAG: BON domain-containing protein [Nitrospirota bacterium]
MKPRMCWNLALALAAPGLLAGCTQILAVPVDAVTAVVEDRPLSEAKDDIGIKASILKAFAEEAKGLLVDVNTDAYGGEVMLTGSVKKSEDRRKAIELARRADGVKNLYNEIQVTEEGGFSASAKDIGIELKLKANLLGTSGVGSINLRWRSVNGIVYYIGQVYSREELDKIMSVTRAVDGVKNIVSHIRIKAHKGS